MEKAFRDVIEFHEKAVGPLSGQAPGLGVSDYQAKLRIRLIEEEAAELVQAIMDNDTAAIADGCADLVYVTIGAALAFGIDLPPVWDAVVAANNAKVKDGCNRDAGGKTVKPEGWRHPDVGAILRDQKSLADIYGK